METNEAPEKIWVHEVSAKELNIPFKDYHIEYIRADAFIEKAAEYFRRCLENTKVIDDYRDILVPGVQASYTSVEEFIEDFKNYIKGE